jgi:hypothetical protein
MKLTPGIAAVNSNAEFFTFSSDAFVKLPTAGAANELQRPGQQ